MISNWARQHPEGVKIRSGNVIEGVMVVDELPLLTRKKCFTGKNGWLPVVGLAKTTMGLWESKFKNKLI